MPRVASLYLPNLAIDRLRIADRAARREAPGGIVPPAPPPVADPVPDPHDDPTACSVPRGGGWRPGARWAREEAAEDDPWLAHRRRKARARAAIADEIATLPLHQRPPMRELGRRSEAADNPFRHLPPENGAAGNRAAMAEAPPSRPTPPDPRALPESSRADCGPGRARPPAFTQAGDPALSPIVDRAGEHLSCPAMATCRGEAGHGRPAPLHAAIAADGRSSPAVACRTGTGLAQEPALSLVVGSHSPCDGACKADAPEIARPRNGPAASRRVRPTASPARQCEAARRDHAGGSRERQAAPGGDVSPILPSPRAAIAASGDAGHFCPARIRPVCSGGAAQTDRPPPPAARTTRARDAARRSAPPERRDDGGPVPTVRTSAPLPQAITPADRAHDPGRPAAGAGDPAPLVTVERRGQRMALAAVCPAARALGLAPGMALAHARALTPGLDARDADPAGDMALLERLARRALRRWTPTAAVSQARDGLWLEIAGVAHLFGGEAAMARRILRFCARAGYDARIAVAGTAGAAYALARHGHRPLILCPTGGEAEALAPLPPVALRLEPHQLDAARRLGLDTIGALIASPRAPLARRFGAGLLARIDQALGRSGEPIEPIATFAAPAVLLRFAEPIATAEAIATALAHAMARLATELTARGLGARMLLLVCLRVDGAEQAIRAGTARATREAGHLLRLLAMRIETIEPGFGIEAIRLTAIRTEPLASQAIDGGLGGDPPPPDLAPLIDRIAGRIGARRLYRIGAVESDVPERSVRPAPPLAIVAEWPLGWARPARLLARPERLDHVLAELPDQPPKRFVWRGVSHVVKRGDGPERIHGEWWRRSGEADAVRDYYQVEDEAGARFWLYRRGDGLDPRTGDLSWHLHGVFG